MESLALENIDASSEVASPGHKLGQTVGVTLQSALKKPLKDIASSRGLYCDCQGPRPGVRAGKKVSWYDSRNTPHDLDYVFEREAEPGKKGQPVAFIEVAWRRYTKHSRAKSGEFESALLPLRQTYSTVRFLGVIAAGEYTGQAQAQLRRNGIEVLVVPFQTISRVFAAEGAKIDYPEKASPTEKAALNRTLESLTEPKLSRISLNLWRAIEGDYRKFESRLVAELDRRAIRVRIVTLYGFERTFNTITDAITALRSEEWTAPPSTREQGYEVFIEFQTGSKVEGRFKTKPELAKFLEQVS